MISLSVARRLKTVANASIAADWRPPSGAKGPTVDLLLPEACYFALNYFIDSDDACVEAGALRVTSRELRGNGIGERLTRSLGALAYKYGYPTINATINSQYSLDIFARVFTEDRLSYHTVNDFGHERAVPVPTSYVRARQILEDFESLETRLEDRIRGFETRVNLDGLDMSSWELPEEQATHGFSWDMIEPPQA